MLRNTDLLFSVDELKHELRSIVAKGIREKKSSMEISSVIGVPTFLLTEEEDANLEEALKSFKEVNDVSPFGHGAEKNKWVITFVD